MFLLRTMQKAKYSSDNIGHFGLALKLYTHFTSPIRRFIDLEVHTLLKDYIKGKYPENFDKLLFEVSNNEVLGRYFINKKGVKKSSIVKPAISDGITSGVS